MINSDNKKAVITLTVLVLIILFGTFMRLWSIGYSSYWIDESFTLMQARGIAHHGYPLLDSGEIDLKDVLVPYILAPAVKLYSFEYPALLRFTSAIFGILSIFVGYHFAVRLFCVRTGLFFAAFIASCHWYIAWSQQIRGYSAAIFFVLLFFLFLTKYHQKPQKKYIFYLFLSLIFGVSAKKICIFLFISLVVYFLTMRKYILSAFSILLCLSLGFYIFSDFKIANSHDFYSYIAVYLKDYLFAYFGVFTIAGFAGFLFSILDNDQARGIHFSIITLFFSAIIFVSGFSYVLEKRYLLIITPFLFLYSACFISRITRDFKNSVLASSLLLFLFLGLGVYFQHGIIIIPQQHYALEHYTPQPNYKKAYDKIKENGFSSDDHVISANPAIDILYLGKSDYYIPWSLTGRGDSTNLVGDREFYTGTRKLYGNQEKTGIDKIHDLQEKGDVYVVFDSLSQKRMKFDIWDDITEEGDMFFEDGDSSSVFVYFFQKID